MKQFKQDGYTVHICTDIVEWGQEFYGIPEQAQLLNVKELERECMGFAVIEDKELWIFVPKHFSDDELAETIAHEVGHIITPEWTTNPSDNEAELELHEQKAMFYENYYKTVRKMLKKALVLIKS